MYGARYKRMNNQREILVQKMTDTKEKLSEYNALRNSYTNNGVEKLVKNENSLIKIIESKDRLVQKQYPVFSDPRPANLFDFRAQFYTPTKYFLGYTFDTVWFNITAIWTMTLFLWITLYFDIFQKIVKSIEDLSMAAKRRRAN